MAGTIQNLRFRCIFSILHLKNCVYNTTQKPTDYK